ncbi:hypothetical protein LEP1GSC047_4149 [Leptospira inadai serovar Lyme str. 10]|uniref:Uncharacterized protein n=2 Tax=Leptospira inadai serovar Lyme TaxID=293084 RepID=V6HCT8_9LEPT|nr:hypothetical protein [Leptospira inadai]EQA37522.1 hypothetical protein LEP1GSC047_4149 [Leptospira inadai serovar Lyme str. 10]PNV73048.1 hypothetical protein BES34_018095 [Leptospira inadai serovar Lyme]
MIPATEVKAYYEEFLSEKKTNRRWEQAGYYIGYGSYLVCFWIVFGLKRENPLFSSLFFFGLFTRFASLMIGQVFLVPKVFLRLLSPEKEESDHAWQTILNHKDEILGRLARNVYGWNDSNDLFEMDRDSLSGFVKEKTSTNWRKIGKNFLLLYFPTLLLTVYLTYLAWLE